MSRPAACGTCSELRKSHVSRPRRHSPSSIQHSPPERHMRSQSGSWTPQKSRTLFWGDVSSLPAKSKVAALAALATSMFSGTWAYAASVPALYTAQQATSGQAVFAQSCAACHGKVLQGGFGPKLVGQSFSAASAKHTIGSIFSFISTQMPLGSGSSLTHAQYEEVMSYILSENGYPAGLTKLEFSDSLASKIPLISQIK